MGRKNARRHNSLRQHLGVGRDFKSRQCTDDRESFLNLGWISSGNLVDDDLRDATLEGGTAVLTPYLSAPSASSR